MNAQTKIEARSLNDAIAACMEAIKPLAKEDRNNHGKYNFAGIDAFLDLTRPICAAHGLTIRQDEESCEVTDNGQLFMRFQFTLHHGDEVAGPYRRSIMVPAKMGSQAFGSAQSYALKQFLRSLFQISTGETDDIDHHDTGTLQAHKPEKAKRVTWAGRYKNKTALHRALTGFERELATLKEQQDMDAFEAFTTTPEYQDFVKEAGEHMPHYLEGGDPAPPEFKGLWKLESDARDACRAAEPNPLMAG